MRRNQWAAAGELAPAQVEQRVQHHVNRGVERGRHDQQQEPWQWRGDYELRPEHARQEPDDRLSQPADAEHAGAERILDQSRHRAGQQARRRA